MKNQSVLFSTLGTPCFPERTYCSAFLVISYSFSKKKFLDKNVSGKYIWPPITKKNDIMKEISHYLKNLV